MGLEDAMGWHVNIEGAQNSAPHCLCCSLVKEASKQQIGKHTTIISLQSACIQTHLVHEHLILEATSVF